MCWGCSLGGRDYHSDDSLGKIPMVFRQLSGVCIGVSVIIGSFLFGERFGEEVLPFFG